MSATIADALDATSHSKTAALLLEKCNQVSLELTSSDGARPSGAAVLAPSRLARLEREVRSYLATPRGAGSQTGLPRLKQRFVGWPGRLLHRAGQAGRRHGGIGGGRVAENLELRRGKPVGGCGGVGGEG